MVMGIRIVLLTGLLAFASPVAAADWQDKATGLIRSEPKVVEAMFPNESSGSFWASVRDDGSRRDGFAQYLCVVLFEAGMPVGQSVVIRVLDAAALVRGEMVTLGRYDCSRKK
jgi:hypothetical protein